MATHQAVKKQIHGEIYCEKSKRQIIVLKVSHFFKPESRNFLVNKILIELK